MKTRMYEQDPEKAPSNTTTNNNAVSVGYIKKKDKVASRALAVCPPGRS